MSEQDTGQRTLNLHRDPNTGAVTGDFEQTVAVTEEKTKKEKTHNLFKKAGNLIESGGRNCDKKETVSETHDEQRKQDSMGGITVPRGPSGQLEQEPADVANRNLTEFVHGKNMDPDKPIDLQQDMDGGEQATYPLHPRA